MFKHVLIVIGVALVGLIVFSYFSFQTEFSSPNHQPAQNEQLIYINGKTLTVEVADEPQEQMKGLSGQASLGPDRGMLFIFPQPMVIGFWMKDMKFHLDFIWIDENGLIIEITKNVSPDTFPKTFMPPSPILYVLEVNAGWSDRNNIRVGDKVPF